MRTEWGLKLPLEQVNDEQMNQTGPSILTKRTYMVGPPVFSIAFSWCKELLNFTVVYNLANDYPVVNGGSDKRSELGVPIFTICIYIYI